MSAFEKQKQASRGFSLVELLAVIAMIGILAAVIGVSMRPSEGASIKSGQRVLSGVFQAARTVASMRSTEARVIIYSDSNRSGNSEKVLRYIGVVYWDEASGDWVAANSGTYLPQGVFYVPAGKSAFEVASGSDVSKSDILDSSSVPEMAARFPSSGGSSEQWYFYAFDSSGNARSELTGASFAGDIVVIAAGRYGPPSSLGGTEIIVDNEFATAGFAVRKTGGTMPLGDYDYVKAAK